MVSLTRRKFLLASGTAMVGLLTTGKRLSNLLAQEPSLGVYARFPKDIGALYNPPAIVHIEQLPLLDTLTANPKIQFEIEQTIRELRNRFDDVAIFDSQYEEATERRVRRNVLNVTTTATSPAHNLVSLAHYIRSERALVGGGLTAAVMSGLPYFPLEEIHDRVRDYQVSACISRRPITHDADIGYVRAVPNSSTSRNV